jgi:hypothetical protein
VEADTGEIVAAELTANAIDDGAQVGPLLDQVAGPGMRLLTHELLRLWIAYWFLIAAFGPGLFGSNPGRLVKAVFEAKGSSAGVRG